jgi:hypothetical protein
MQDIGNELKNVLVNNKIGKTRPNHLPPQHLLFHQLLRNPFRSEQKPRLKDSKPTTLCVDLSGKLDSKGKLTQQERQHRIDKNLCLFCRGSSHRTDTCPVKSARGRAITTESVPTPSKLKESGTSSKKD